MTGKQGTLDSGYFYLTGVPAFCHQIYGIHAASFLSLIIRNDFDAAGVYGNLYLRMLNGYVLDFGVSALFRTPQVYAVMSGLERSCLFPEKLYNMLLFMQSSFAGNEFCF